MPRDLLADRNILQEMAQLERESPSSAPQETASPEPIGSNNSSSNNNNNNNNNNQLILVDDKSKKMQAIHPFSSLLNIEDLDDCDWLEHAAFDAIEAATREKLEYRLRTCGELCSGLFSTAYATSPGPLGNLIKTRTFPSLDSHDADRKRVMLAHIIATKSKTHVVTDDTMDYPKDFRTKYQLDPSVGHTEDGDTVCIHSLCVHPDYAKKGLGQILLKSYTQRIKDAGIAKRIALICRDHLVSFYEKAGFKKIGPSKCQYGGGNWVDMVLDFDGSMDDHDF